MKNSDIVTWFKAAGIRAIRTMAQTAVGAIGGAALFTEVNWAVVGSSALLAGILSMLMSISGLPEVEKMEYEDAGDLDE